VEGVGARRYSLVNQPPQQSLVSCNVDLTVPPGRDGPFRPDPPRRVAAAIQETIAAR